MRLGAMPDRSRATSTKRTSRRRGAAFSSAIRHSFRAPDQKPLYTASDQGSAVFLRPEHFAPSQREGGWGAFAESFIRLNAPALQALDTRAELGTGTGGVSVRLVPGGRTGAIPLRSAQTGHVTGGFVVRPRFGWAGVGRVLTETGWHTAPEFLELPLVPGSGREVPPWVLAGPVLARLAELLRAVRRGYREIEAIVRRPRGRILWGRYCAKSLVRGRWDQLPCRFPDLESDPRLRRAVRWTVERLHRDLLAVGKTDPVAVALAAIAVRLLDQLLDVTPLMPSKDELRRSLGMGHLLGEALRRGIEAIAWIVEERGLGGGRELDGLAWQLPLDRLWEAYVEAVVRREAAITGGEVKVGRLGQTTFPLHWSDPTHRSLGHLVPDIVVRRGRFLHVIDAKYKAHLVELDDAGWHKFADESREAHRSDLHQILAYAGLYDADKITATLVYPLRRETWLSLRARGRDRSSADLLHGGRRLRLELRGLPFGAATDDL